jgi:hypothetical protein
VNKSAFSLAVFPFLKTSAPVMIGDYRFRSTLDVEGLPPEQATAVGDIARMLFAHGDRRVVSASYAITPYIDLGRPDPEFGRLTELRAAVAYLYSAPHGTFDTVFLTPENVSLAIFSPGPVSVFLVRSEHHLERVGPETGPAPDERHHVPGFAGYYNFTHSFWVEPGGRLYGPAPHIGLNLSQDLANEFDHFHDGRPDRPLLMKLLSAPPSATSKRIFTALRWYNAANEAAAGPDRALLDLAIAFEALFALPADAKTERLVDAISLLLGRTDRIEQWARQFYAARSAVVHEGAAREHYFDVGTPIKGRDQPDLFGSLMLYGRQIFQLALSTFLVGADLAKAAGLQDRLVSNAERYTRICAALDADQGAPSDRLRDIAGLVDGLEQFRFVTSAPVPQHLMLGALRSACSALLASGVVVDPPLIEALQQAAAQARKKDELGDLAAVEALTTAFKAEDQVMLEPITLVVRDLAEAVWNVLFMRYFDLQGARSDPAESEPDPPVI